MRCNKMIIGLFSLCLILLGLFAGTFREAPEVALPGEISFRIGSGENAEQIRCWENNDNTVYVFLPGYAQLSDVRIWTEGESRYLINGTEVSEGDTCAAYALEDIHSLEIRAGGRRAQKNLVFVKSSEIPVMYIDVQSGSMDYIHMDKDNKESGTLRLYDAAGNLLCKDTLQTIKGRGNSSWGAEKKPYNLVLSAEKNLLGMGAAQRWVLLAEGYNPVVIRNKVVYDFARSLGFSYSPECQWVDLYLNGEYAGLYELSEKNEVHSERVDISLENGGFLVSMEYESRLKDQKYPYVLTEAGQALRVRSETTDIGSIQLHWQTLENAILSEDGIDPVSGKHWQDLIDLDSWARKYLIEEVFGNLDAGSLSQFYYYDGQDPGGKVYAGPVWDYDFSMGGEDPWLRPYSDFFVMNREAVNDEIYTPWFAALYQKEEFLTRVKELYESDFLPGLEQLMETELDRYIVSIEHASEMNRLRWHWRYTGQQELQEEFTYLKKFLEKRTAFLVDLWINEAQYHTVCVDADINGYFAVKDGALMPERLRIEEPGGYGWYDVRTDEPFDINQPIYEDAHIYIKRPDSTLSRIHYIPVAAMVMMLPLLLVLDRTRNKSNRRPENESVKAN